MAPSAKFLSFFLLSLLFSHQQAQARSFFFSKVPNVDNHNTEELPNKVVTKQEQEPTFIPQTQQNGYGLYGHDSTEQLNPSTATTTTTTTEDNTPYTHYNPNKNSNYYNNNNYETNDQNGISDTRLTQQRGYTTTPTSQHSNSYYSGERQGMSDTRNTQQRGYTTTTTPTTQNSNDYYNTERQGMSDTRFMENGKYYYDLDSDNNNYNQKNQYRNSQVLDSRNWYTNNNNNKGYYGSNNGNQNIHL